MYVNDLAREIAFIEEWYRGRFSEMDAYFGIDPLGIEEVRGQKEDVRSEETLNSQLSTLNCYDLTGRRYSGKPTKPGLYINGGKKAVVIKH
jgi:hypothetical protein